MTEESMSLHFAEGVGMKIGKCELCERLPIEPKAIVVLSFRVSEAIEEP
jgi:hypothetical protein